MRIGVIGSGQVAETLGSGFIRHGHEVMLGSRTPEKLESWRSQQGKAGSIGDLAQTARFGELIVLAVKGSGAEAAVRQAGVDNLAGKPVLDATNPIAEGPVQRSIFAVTRAADAARPSTQAVLAAVRDAVAALAPSPPRAQS